MQERTKDNVWPVLVRPWAGVSLEYGCSIGWSHVLITIGCHECAQPSREIDTFSRVGDIYEPFTDSIYNSWGVNTPIKYRRFGQSLSSIHCGPVLALLFILRYKEPCFNVSLATPQASQISQPLIIET